MTARDLQLVVAQTVPGSKEAAFKAWTTAAELEQWWGPPGGYCSEARVDLRVGGHYLIRNVLPDGSTITIEGRYLEIREPDLLRYTWQTGGDSSNGEHVTVRFDDHDEGTQVTVTHDRLGSQPEVDGHRQGWVACLGGLATHLEGTA